MVYFTSYSNLVLCTTSLIFYLMVFENYVATLERYDSFSSTKAITDLCPDIFDNRQCKLLHDLIQNSIENERRRFELQLEKERIMLKSEKNIIGILVETIIGIKQDLKLLRSKSENKINPANSVLNEITLDNEGEESLKLMNSTVTNLMKVYGLFLNHT